jgi:hypothetical protein
VKLNFEAIGSNFFTVKETTMYEDPVEWGKNPAEEHFLVQKVS